MNKDYITYALDGPYPWTIYIKEQINELDSMTSNTIRTQVEAINATRAGQYVIMSVSSNGDFSMSVSPVPHANALLARAECQRLASINPGKLFVFVKLAGGEMVPTSTVSI